MNTKDIITEALSLPLEQRAMIADSLLKSLNPPEPAIDKKWAVVAKKRLSELRTGQVNALSGEEVFRKIWKRLSK